MTFEITTDLAADVVMQHEVIVYSEGQQVGSLFVSSNNPHDDLFLEAPQGSVPYQLEMIVTWLDGSQSRFGGEGTLNAYDGASYYVTLTPMGSDYQATLRAGT